MDLPFLEVETVARKIVDDGGVLYQQWTCGGCRERVTGNIKNFLAVSGHCEKCNHTTDLLETGCGFVAFVGKE